jgi:hypothetical protein
MLPLAARPAHHHHLNPISTTTSFLALLTLLSLASLASAQCVFYSDYAFQQHEPYSTGRYNLSYQRPIEPCRTFESQDLEEAIRRLKREIVDPDLSRLFENTWPNTLDTTIGWRGYANHTKVKTGTEAQDGTVGEGEGNNLPAEEEEDDTEKEELTFVVTGDIEAMWLRDSANQLQAYTSLLKPSPDFNSLASVFRGAINLQARYILEAPFCNAFQAPPESGIPAKSSVNSDQITPSFDFFKVFSCNWELDSLASFLQLSIDYVSATQDFEFFGKFNWVKAVEMVLNTTESMRVDSYDDKGQWLHTPYTYCAPYGGTPINNCNGSPHKGNIGMIRTFHRPSDDACMFQYLVPANMMFSRVLNDSALIMQKLEETNHPMASTRNLSSWMRTMSLEIHQGIEKYGVVQDPKYGRIYAYEVDGYGSANLIDDPNIPSLLSAPFLGYLPATNKIYQNTRRRILSRDNPYYAWGPAISGPASQHTGPGKPWPMALVMQILTSDDDKEIFLALRDLLRSTDGTGLVHESVASGNDRIWSRQWFAWANGLLGQAVLDLERRKPHLLKMGFQ